MSLMSFFTKKAVPQEDSSNEAVVRPKEVGSSKSQIAPSEVGREKNSSAGPATPKPDSPSTVADSHGKSTSQSSTPGRVGLSPAPPVENKSASCAIATASSKASSALKEGDSSSNASEELAEAPSQALKASSNAAERPSTSQTCNHSNVTAAEKDSILKKNCSAVQKAPGAEEKGSGSLSADKVSRGTAKEGGSANKTGLRPGDRHNGPSKQSSPVGIQWRQKARDELDTEKSAHQLVKGSAEKGGVEADRPPVGDSNAPAKRSRLISRDAGTAAQLPMLLNQNRTRQELEAEGKVLRNDISALRKRLTEAQEEVEVMNAAARTFLSLAKEKLPKEQSDLVSELFTIANDGAHRRKVDKAPVELSRVQRRKDGRWRQPNRSGNYVEREGSSEAEVAKPNVAQVRSSKQSNVKGRKHREKQGGTVSPAKAPLPRVGPKADSDMGRGGPRQFDERHDGRKRNEDKIRPWDVQQRKPEYAEGLNTQENNTKHNRNRPDYMFAGESERRCRQMPNATTSNPAEVPTTEETRQVQIRQELRIASQLKCTEDLQRAISKARDAKMVTEAEHAEKLLAKWKRPSHPFED